jgi:thiaminase/transcriptional activator TenA
MFRDYFREKGLSPEDVAALEYLPTSHAYSGFLRRVARDGSFPQIVATLLGVEWPYLDWAQRLTAAGKRPDNRYYRTWIDIHAGRELADFVTWMRSTLDACGVGVATLEKVFLATLRYEYMFWEMAYRGEAWPR